MIGRVSGGVGIFLRMLAPNVYAYIQSGGSGMMNQGVTTAPSPNGWRPSTASWRWM